MKVALLLALLALFAVSTLATRPLAPLLVAENDSLRVDGEYLVQFNDVVSSNAVAAALFGMSHALSVANDGSEIKSEFSIGESFRGFHAVLSADMLERVRAHPFVAFVEENQRVHINQDECQLQDNSIWGLSRIAEHDISLVDDIYKYTETGKGVDVYIIDTGVLTTHEEFAGRAEWGANFVNDNINQDCNGHGTHVAGTVAGTLYGVAKEATIIAVKVLGCSGSGTWAGVVSGIDWTANEAPRRGKPSVANMSLGGGVSALVNNAVAAAVDAGVTFAVAAGNENTDACSRSPASEPKALTVAATTIVARNDGTSVDRRASFSNFGKCVDIAAPGQLIKAAWINQSGVPPNTATNTISGTSMASPHVAGVAALVLSVNPDFTPAQVEQALYAVATEGVIDLGCSPSSTSCPATPNRLLYSSC